MEVQDDDDEDDAAAERFTDADNGMGGLSSQQALNKLIDDIHAVLKVSYSQLNLNKDIDSNGRHVGAANQWRRFLNVPFLKRTFGLENETSLFTWTSLAVSLMHFAMLAFCGEILVQVSNVENRWLTCEAVIIFILMVLNIFLNVWESFQSEVEMCKRMEHVLRQLIHVQQQGVHWTLETFPHLHTPLSASAALQWTYRDGQKVNCPWALLVEGDLILLKPGQICPGKCSSMEDPNVRMEADQVLHIQTKLDEEISPIPVFKTPAQPQLFRLEETPYIRAVARQVLDVQSEVNKACKPLNEKRQDKQSRPTSLLHKRRHFFFIRLLTHTFMPIMFTISFTCTLVRFLLEWHVYEPETGMQLARSGNTSLPLGSRNKAMNDVEEKQPMEPIDALNGDTYSLVQSQYVFARFFLDTVTVTLPLIPLTFPFCWIIANYSALARILSTFCSIRHVKITEDPFEDTVERPDVIQAMSRDTSWHNLKAYFVSGFLGKGEYLSRTENLVHTLGSLTSLCCTDKKGILSWPNTSAEKVFLLKKDPPSNATATQPADACTLDTPYNNDSNLTSTFESSAFERKNDNIKQQKGDYSSAKNVKLHSGLIGTTSKSRTSQSSQSMSAEILTITHDIHNPFKVDFDDPAWSKYMDHLKPLGLSILLNTCNISTEEKYTNFFNHLICESTRVVHGRGKQQQAQKDKKKGTRNDEENLQSATCNKFSSTRGTLDTEEDTTMDYLHASPIVPDNENVFDETELVHSSPFKQGETVNMLPIVTRGCLCALPKKLGLTSRTTNGRFQLSNQIQTFRRISRVDPMDNKFARNLSLARLKFPFPHMVSVAVQQRTTGGWQLFSQGTADIVLDSCTDAWSGEDLETMTGETRKKISDFYQRASLSSYCTAFSFRPLTLPPPLRGGKEYLQLPTNSLPFYWQYSEGTECADLDAINTHIPYNDMIRSTISEEEEDEYKVADSCQTGGSDGEGPGLAKTRADAMACLQLECNQTFLGMVQLQYQPVVDVVQLIDFLEKACVRFVHFSKENELRSRVFSEKMGLESGWNCHISLRNADKDPEAIMERTVSYSNQGHASGGKKKTRTKRNWKMNNKGECTEEKLTRRPRTASEAERSELKKTKIGASLPVHLDRPAWFLDFPKWQELRGGNGERKGSLTQAQQNQQLPEQLETLLENPLGDDYRQSRQTSVTSDSEGVPFEYDMANRAQLPRGIENIRPHLETMDNVPLLVSLFTDCTPETSREMVLIMQDYGEVVCIMGSSANYQNVKIFLQSNASLAIEPRYPQLCQDVPVFRPPMGGGPSPVAVSQLLNSVASSLSFRMEDEISMFHLILESRHFNLSMWNAMQFWTCSLIFVSVCTLSSNLLMLPPLLTPGQSLYLCLLFIPVLAMSLLGSKPHPNIMNLSTGKNVVDYFQVGTIRYVAWCYGLRFLPTIVILAFAHLLSIMDLKLTCSKTVRKLVTSSAEVFQKILLGANSSISNHDFQNRTEMCCELPLLQQLHIYQHLNMLLVMVYLVFISMSFLFREHQLWQRHVKNNLLWFKLLGALTLVQILYTICAIFLIDNGVMVEYHWNDGIAPFEVWAVWIFGIPIVIGINEFVKRKEIKVEVRHQRRQRLEFGTKLGINSPF